MKQIVDKYDLDQTIIRLRWGKQKPGAIKFSLLPLNVIAKIVGKSYYYCHSVSHKYFLQNMVDR